MFIKFAFCLTTRTKTSQLRYIHQISSNQSSYLKNLGSEPLIIATLGDRFAEIAHKNPGRVAVKSIHEDVTLTYEELLNKADSFGCALHTTGFKKGDKLGFWSHNCSQWIIAFVGAIRAGVVPVLINPVYEKPELSYCISKAKLKGIVTGEAVKNMNYNKVLHELIPELNSSKDGAIASPEFPTLSSIITSGKEKMNGIFSLDSLIKDHANNNAILKYGSEVKPEDACVVHFTSGSTSNPKAVEASHLGVVNNTYFTGIRSNYNERNEIVCIQTPLFHALGSLISLLSPMHHGGTMVLASPIYSPSATINALCAEKCSALIGTPTMYVDLLSLMKNQGTLPIKLNMALAGGAPCSPELIRRLNELFKGAVVRGMYGLTECTACLFQSMPSDGADLVADTVGYITDHVEVKVVDGSGNIVPFGNEGELVARGYNNMICYFDDPVKTKETVTKDGWIYTGDKFIITPDGYGKIVGRIKDIIIRGGENIAPKEIEDCINTHPDIIESQVIGVSDERLGEELCAVVRVRDSAKFTLEDLKKHCSEKLAKYKIPRILKLTETFPKTASGKIQKYRIKEYIESGKI